jgi:voltage-gated potassium channel
MLPLLTWLERFKKRKSVAIQIKLEEKLLSAVQYLFIIICLHSLLIRWLEGYSWGDALWLALTTITTVGYGDIQINSFGGRIATVLLLYAGGIFVLAKVVADYFEYHSSKHQQQFKGEWRWNMSNHILIISDHEEPLSELFYQRLIHEFQQAPLYKNSSIQILTQDFASGLPELLQLSGITYYKGKGNSPTDLGAVNCNRAKIIIILAQKPSDPSADGHTFDILHRIRDINSSAFIIAECVDDVNRKRLQQAGANIMVRPIRAYPEMIVGVLCAPGTEQVLENMFTQQGDRYQRVEVILRAKEWAEVVYQLIKADIGTAIAYIDPNGLVFCNPSGEEKIVADALIIMVRDGKDISAEQVAAILAN